MSRIRHVRFDDFASYSTSYLREIDDVMIFTSKKIMKQIIEAMSAISHLENTDPVEITISQDDIK